MIHLPWSTVTGLALWAQHEQASCPCGWHAVILAIFAAVWSFWLCYERWTENQSKIWIWRLCIKSIWDARSHTKWPIIILLVFTTPCMTRCVTDLSFFNLVYVISCFWCSLILQECKYIQQRQTWPSIHSPCLWNACSVQMLRVIGSPLQTCSVQWKPLAFVSIRWRLMAFWIIVVHSGAEWHSMESSKAQWCEALWQWYLMPNIALADIV